MAGRRGLRGQLLHLAVVLPRAISSNLTLTTCFLHGSKLKLYIEDRTNSRARPNLRT